MLTKWQNINIQFIGMPKFWSQILRVN